MTEEQQMQQVNDFIKTWNDKFTENQFEVTVGFSSEDFIRDEITFLLKHQCSYCKRKLVFHLRSVVLKFNADLDVWCATLYIITGKNYGLEYIISNEIFTQPYIATLALDSAYTALLQGINNARNYDWE